jgi:hypothetical protein
MRPDVSRAAHGHDTPVADGQCLGRATVVNDHLPIHENGFCAVGLRGADQAEKTEDEGGERPHGRPRSLSK